MKVENIIFDFGGVLADWKPRYLYKDTEAFAITCLNV